MGTEFLLAVNIAIALLLGGSFLAIAIYDTKRVSARWFASSYFLGATFFAVEFLVPLREGGEVMESVGYVAFLIAIVIFNGGLSRLYDVRQPLVLAVAVVIIGLWAKIASDGMARDSLVRMLIYQAPYFVLQTVGMGIILASRHRRRLDTVLAGMLGLTALHYVMKPFVAMRTDGPGATPADYTSTLYAQIGQTAAAVLAVGVALLLLVILVRDLIAELTERSETDLLSGLLNRRGFERRVAAASETWQRPGLPVSLVLCDLDHFKQINDNFGHAAGDRVIEAFARTLGEAVADNQIVGRVGGEEFAMLLPGCPLPSARLFAENVRNRIVDLAVEGLPEGHRVTASFGVAERAAGEDIPTLHQRADAALYAAKAAGRDCVRAAPPRAEPSPREVVNAGREGQSR